MVLDVPDPADDPGDLPLTAYAVLGLLSFGHELSGYDLKKWADNSLRFFWWAPAASNVYGELRRLEALGLVAPGTPGAGSARRRRTYAITEAGRRRLADWQRTAPLDPVVLKHPAALRVWLGHVADAGTVRALVEEHVVNTRRTLAEIERAGAVAPDEDAMRYPVAVLEWARDLYRADLEASRRLLDRLEGSV
jgi:DNA-binding PadR family transcriptional regulator